jgi:hypothetical protein
MGHTNTMVFKQSMTYLEPLYERLRKRQLVEELKVRRWEGVLACVYVCRSRTPRFVPFGIVFVGIWLSPSTHTVTVSNEHRAYSLFKQSCSSVPVHTTQTSHIK